MFKKIEITNVGRCKSLKTEGDEQYFKKNTFIYGKNTYGKSTITAILRSLKENKPDYIIGRKTIGSQKQLIKIIPETLQPTGEYRYSTEEGKWNSNYEDILIFDNNFVRESVYTHNQQIGSEQQKNIEAFMIGKKGIEYIQQIQDISKKIQENTQIQLSINNDYSRNKHLLGNLDFSAFIQLKEINEVPEKIEKINKELDNLKNSDLISSKLVNLITVIEKYEKFDPEDIRKKVTANSELISKHFINHINQKESKQAYSAFLQTGSKLRSRNEEELCPFCTQEITSEAAKNFWDTVDSIYNEAYRKLVQELKLAENIFSTEEVTSEIEGLVNDLKQAGFSVTIDFSDFLNQVSSCQKEITKKKEDLSTDISIDQFTDLSTKAGEIAKEAKTALALFKNPEEKKGELEKELKLLIANKERFGSWQKRCEDYISAKNKNETLSGDKKKTWGEYLSYTDQLSDTILQDINGILNACNCNFTAQSFKFKGNQRQELFALVMNGGQIGNNGLDHQPTIKNCLSDSDKWVLALAFFLATVKNDDGIKIVIMDDPVSSFDVDRKRIIFKEINKILSGTDKQLILLTHEKGFYHLIHKETEGEDSSVFLKIMYDHSHGSDLYSCDCSDDPEFMTEYNLWIAEMKEALTSQDISKVKTAQSNVRKVIEHILKSKYPLELSKEHNTIEKMLTKLEETDGSYSKQSPRNEINALLTNINHHDNSGNGQYPSSELGIEDYRKDIKDAFDLIKKV